MIITHKEKQFKMLLNSNSLLVCSEFRIHQANNGYWLEHNVPTQYIVC